MCNVEQQDLNIILFMQTSDLAVPWLWSVRVSLHPQSFMLNSSTVVEPIARKCVHVSTASTVLGTGISFVTARLRASHM